MAKALQDIELLATDDLVAELLKRFDAAIFAGIQVGTAADRNEVQMDWTGCGHTCAGLAQHVSLKAIQAAEGTT
jgi:hypothetical protein